jgi:hypothetical protein
MFLACPQARRARLEQLQAEQRTLDDLSSTAEQERTACMASERQALHQELANERANFELEKRRMQEDFMQQQAQQRERQHHQQYQQQQYHQVGANPLP